MLQEVCEREEGTKTRSIREGEPKAEKWAGWDTI